MIKFEAFYILKSKDLTGRPYVNLYDVSIYEGEPDPDLIEQLANLVEENRGQFGHSLDPKNLPLYELRYLTLLDLPLELLEGFEEITTPEIPIGSLS